MKAAFFHITPAEVVSLLTGDAGPGSLLPADCRVHRASYDADCDRFTIVVESRNLMETPEGVPFHRIDPSIQRVEREEDALTPSAAVFRSLARRSD